MDLYSEELNLDIGIVDCDENQVECKEYNINTDSGVAEEIYGGKIIYQESGSKVNTENGKSQNLGEQSCVTSESQSENENKTFITATEIKLTSQELEKINSECIVTGPREESESPNTNVADESVKQQRRRRRTIKELYDHKPTRESTRKRKNTPVFDHEISTKKLKRHWTVKDKKQLLRGLEEFGVDDINSIKSYLPYKSTGAISSQIRMWKEIGRKNLEHKLLSRKKKRNQLFSNCILRLNKWTKHFEELAIKFPQNHFALSNVFLLISEYGKFPTPNESGGIDFRAMYRYLHCMLNGKPYFGVNQKTAEVLLQCVNNMLRHLNGKPQSNLLLSHLPKQPDTQPLKTYGRHHIKKFPSIAQEPEAFLHLLDVNPLNMPVQMLLKENRNDTDSEVDQFPFHDDDKSNSSDSDDV